MYYPSSENKGADQLRGYREADLRLCFRLCTLLVFPCGGSYNVFQLRLYTVAIQDSEISQHIGYVTLERPVWKYYGNLHFRMEDSSGTTTLTNSGRLSAATATLSGGQFVTVRKVKWEKLQETDTFRAKKLFSVFLKRFNVISTCVYNRNFCNSTWLANFA